MYAPFFGLRQEPFSIAPDPRYLLMTERHREALAHLLYGVNGGGGFVLLSGEIGTGKTTVAGATTVNTLGGDITQTDVVKLLGGATLDASDGTTTGVLGSITLSNTGNNFVGQLALTAGSTSLASSTDLTMGTVYNRGSLELSSAGSISMDKATTIFVWDRHLRC